MTSITRRRGCVEACYKRIWFPYSTDELKLVPTLTRAKALGIWRGETQDSGSILYPLQRAVLCGRDPLQRVRWQKLVAFMVVLIGLCWIFWGGQGIVWAAEAHVARPSVVTLQHTASTSAVRKVSTKNNVAPPSTPTLAAERPIVIKGQWYCPLPDEAPQAQVRVVGGVPQYSEVCTRGGSFIFPCSDHLNLQDGSMQPSEQIIRGDWLVGDVPVVGGSGRYVALGGHFVYTWSSDTYESPQIITLFGYMEGIGFLLVAPSVILIGYQIMLGISSFRYANAFEGLSRVVLGALAIWACYGVVATLISLETVSAAAVLLLHVQHPFPRVSVNGVPVPYVLTGTTPPEPDLSYRGIVVPISRWGCAINEFFGIFSVPFVNNTLGSIVPLMSGFTHLAEKAMTIADVIHRMSGMVLMIMSVVLWIQVFMRIFLLNYYILTGPLAFGCWALPGKVGQRVLRLWFKGFISMLFLQVFQLFILTMLPLLLPALPQIPADSVGFIQSFLLEFPPILTLFVTLMAPRLLGASAAKAFGTAGSMAGGIMVAVGSAAFQIC